MKQSDSLTTHAFLEVFLEMASVAWVISQVLGGVLMSEGKIGKSSFLCMAELEQKPSLTAPFKHMMGSDSSHTLQLSLYQGSLESL